MRQSTDLKGHTASIEKVAFNPVKELELCSVSADGTARFWDVKTKALLNEVKGLGETFTLAWAPNGEHVVVGNKVCAIFTVAYEGSRLRRSTGGQTICAVANTKHANLRACTSRPNKYCSFRLEWAESICRYR